jgi:hypothetical protein
MDIPNVVLIEWINVNSQIKLGKFITLKGANKAKKPLYSQFKQEHSETLSKYNSISNKIGALPQTPGFIAFILQKQ